MSSPFDAMQSITPWQEELYLDLHRHPELSMQEDRTRAIIAAKLTELEFETLEVGGGVVGVMANGEGPTVLFRADFDGLPVREETGLDYASVATQVDRNGVEQPTMHACGHDMHVACALGAAALLSGAKDSWQGTYIALFQPGEEKAEGAASMIAAGLTGLIPKPDVAFGQHVLGSPVSGHVAVKGGPVLSTAASVRVKVFGHGSHGSMPHLGVDPVVIAASIVTELQTIVSRELAPGEFGVVTVGALNAGTSANIIPDSAELLINTRAYSRATRETILAAIDRIVRAQCVAGRSPKDPEIEVYDSYPLTSNDDDAARRVFDGLVAHFGPERVEVMEPATASEDFSVVPDAFGTPYVYWGFGGFTADQTVYPNHNPHFAPAMQPTMQTGTEAAAAAALAYLGK